MRFLVDECLSIDLLSLASQQGFEAHHVARVGRAGWKDWNVLRYAAEGDLILVTNNASDFRRLYATELLHPGLIIIIPSVGRQEQRLLLSAAIEELIAVGEPINQVLEIDIVGDDVVLTRYEWPST